METPILYICLNFSYFLNKNIVLIYFKVIWNCTHFGSSEAEAEFNDIMKETKSGLLKIMLPFAPYKCSACLVILESPAKLVEHMGVRHKEDFIEFCAKCQKTMPKLKSIAIYYGKCSRGLTGRSARARADKQREAVIVEA